MPTFIQFLRHALATLAFTLPVAALAQIAAPLAEPGPDQGMPWVKGPIARIGTVQACLSNPPRYTDRVLAYAGFSHPPPLRTPAVGEVFYTHVLIGHPGNPCSGSAVGLELILPPGVQIAYSPANPVFCFSARGNPLVLYNLDVDADYGCPTTFPQGLEGYMVIPKRGGLGSAWGMHQGFYIEILVPLIATQAQAGNNLIRWRINPDIGVVGYAQIGPQVNNDVLFRSAMEDDMLTLDLCTLSPTPQGC